MFRTRSTSIQIKTRIVNILKWKQLSTTTTVTLKENDFHYDSVYKNFKWNIPKNFNFAQDVIDKYAKDPEKCDSTAFHFMSDDKGTKIWTFKDLSQDSKIMASGLLKLGPISRAMIILPRIPEWWLLNLATMRTNTVLLPGTSQLTSSDIDRYIFYSHNF